MPSKKQELEARAAALEGARALIVKTADYTATAADCTAIPPNVFVNTGASATVTVTLPAAVAGMRIGFLRNAAQLFRADANGSEFVGIGTTGQYAEIQTLNGYLELECFIAGKWVLKGSSGTIAYA